MSDDSSKPKPLDKAGWGAWTGILAAVTASVGGQLLGFFLVRSYIHIAGRGDANTTLQFTFVVLSELCTLGILWLLLRKRRLWHTIGLGRPRVRDALFMVLGAVVYYVLYVAVISALASAVHINVDQKQEIGFDNVAGTLPLIMTGVSLVLLPPIVEEITFRGVIFRGFRARLPVLAAALFTSAIFAALHLPEGGDGKLLWIAGVDTFVLSMVLCYVREKTGSLWACMGVHAIKNGVAFVTLFILHVH